MLMSCLVVKTDVGSKLESNLNIRDRQGLWGMDEDYVHTYAKRRIQEDVSSSHLKRKEEADCCKNCT